MELSSLIPIIAIVMPFVMIISIQIAKTISRTQQERMRMEVMRAAIERGQPIPAEALRPRPDPEDDELSQPSTPEKDIRVGLICLGAGIGLFLMFSTFSIGGFTQLQGLRWVGAIPGFVGLALIVNGLITRTPRTSAPPAGAGASETKSDLHR